MGLGNWRLGKGPCLLIAFFFHVAFQVFNCSSTDESRPIRSHSWVDFLDEFRIIMTSTGNRPDGPELLVFDTLVPQDHPRNLRRFGLPLQNQSGRQVCIYLYHDRSSGTVNRDGPLITDPTQAIFVICSLTDFLWSSSFCGYNI